MQEGKNALPNTISTFGSTVEEIFVCYEDLVAKYGKDDLVALTPEAAQVSGIPYVMDAYREEAEKIINA